MREQKYMSQYSALFRRWYLLHPVGRIVVVFKVQGASNQTVHTPQTNGVEEFKNLPGLTNVSGVRRRLRLQPGCGTGVHLLRP